MGSITQSNRCVKTRNQKIVMEKLVSGNLGVRAGPGVTGRAEVANGGQYPQKGEE